MIETKNEIEQYNETEYTANNYVIKCTGIMTTMTFIVWVLNLLDIFVVNQQVVTKSMLLTVTIYVIGRLIFYKTGLKKYWIKYFLILWAICIGTIIVTFLTYHAVVGSLIPMIYAGMYCNKKMSLYTYVLVVISIFISVFGGYYYGVCDANMVLLTKETLSQYVDKNQFILSTVNDNVAYTLTMFFVIPRSMICLVVSAVSNTVSKIISANADYAKEMKKLAEYDGMTGVYNKSKYIEVISQDSDSDEKLAVIFWDINNLKDVNDTKGHEKGDQLITSIGRTISKMVTDSDSAFRIGGDEFVLIMNNSEEQDVIEKIELWKQLLKDENRNSDINLSAAYGYACGAKKDIVNLISKADEMMYENKRKYKEHIL